MGTNHERAPTVHGTCTKRCSEGTVHKVATLHVAGPRERSVCAQNSQRQYRRGSAFLSHVQKVD